MVTDCRAYATQNRIGIKLSAAMAVAVGSSNSASQICHRHWASVGLDEGVVRILREDLWSLLLPPAPCRGAARVVGPKFVVGAAAVVSSKRAEENNAHENKKEHESQRADGRTIASGADRVQ